MSLHKKTMIVFSGLVFISIAAAAPADFTGTVVGTHASGWTAAGPVVLADIPSMQYRELVSGECYGPCFSPDGKSIAYVKSGQIYTVKADGSALPQATGIQVCPASPRPLFQSYPAIYWLNLRDTAQYFYWSRNNTAWWDGTRSSGAEGLFRCKVGTTAVQQLVNGAYTWAGFSADGTRAVGMRDDYRQVCFDLVAKTSYLVPTTTNNCNSSISADGSMVACLLGPETSYSPYDQGAMLVRNWWGGDTVRVVVSLCLWDAPRWSHSVSNIMVMQLGRDLEHAGHDCSSAFTSSSTIGAGMLYNVSNRDTLRIPEFYDFYTPFDYFKTTIGPIDTPSAASPDFSPSNNGLLPGDTTITIRTATTGAFIRYTTNGTQPTATQGTLISSSSGTVRITVGVSDTIVMQAIAFKTGMKPSGVATKRYWVEMQPFTITAPQAGQKYRVGDTLIVKWTMAGGVSPSGVNVQLSLNDGKYFDPINALSIHILDSAWGDFRWPIPAFFNGASTITSTAIVRVCVYDFEEIGANSGRFSIASPTSARSVLSPVPSPENFSITGNSGRLVVFHTGADDQIVRIFSMKGAPLSALIAQARNEIAWDGRDQQGNAVPTGLYWARQAHGKSLLFFMSPNRK
jgi:hypothetical protein